MKIRFLSLILATLVMVNSASAAPVRDALLDGGQELIENPELAPNFVENVERLHEEVPLSLQERAYLKDLSDKLPERLRQDLCNGDERLVCGPELSEREHHPLFAGSLAPSYKAAETTPPSMKQGKVSTSWWVLAVAGGLALSYGLRNKEIQVSPR